jgi:hypothetical protein
LVFDIGGLYAIRRFFLSTRKFLLFLVLGGMVSFEFVLKLLKEAEKNVRRQLVGADPPREAEKLIT